MPRQEHIHRQIEWEKELSRYGETEIEKTLYIRGAEVFADVYAKIAGKEYIIEIGDIADKRKEALLEIYAEHNKNIIFLHEHYGENKIPQVLETVEEFQAQYGQSNQLLEVLERHNNNLHKQNGKKLFFALSIWIVFAGILGYGLSAYPTSYMLAGIFISSLPLSIWVTIMARKKKHGCNCSTCQEARIFLDKNNPVNSLKQTKEKGNRIDDDHLDKSVYSSDPKATQEDDMEEDLALLDDEDTGW